jgi:hypothetical protein
LSSMTNTGDRAGLPETGTGTPQRSGHRFENGRQAASAEHTCTRETGKRSPQAEGLPTDGDVRDCSRMAANRHGHSNANRACL